MSIYETLNPAQQEAVYHVGGPLLLLAGAGSGKTRVLTHRIAYMIEEAGINPWNIMAITFTNKAAGEMRERVDKIVSFGAEDVWVSTFHSSCVRILRRFIDKLGYDRNFTIYDTDDQKVVMRDVCKRMNIDTKVYKERSLMSAISSAKDELISPEEYLLQHPGDFAKQRIGNVYKEYQAVLRKNNALDFDDLIFKTVELFRQNPDVLEYYQERFKYIMVDEYQDTNTAQFKFVSLLAAKYRNLCVVGDDDQSIYKFRGANIYNILNFEQEYPDAHVIKLEQNYRSTKNILNAANDVIHNNKGRKAKRLWTSNATGDLIEFQQYYNETEEAEGITMDILDLVQKGGASYSDCAVLYRTNAQSRSLEERCVIKGIPYKIVGGQNFYQRKEIKDLLAYLKTVDNGLDDVAVKRIINVPKRGIGATSVGKVDEFAAYNKMSFFDAAKMAKEIPGLGRAADKIQSFADQILVYRTKVPYIGISGLLDEIISDTEYVKLLNDEGTPEAESRIENIDELKNKIAAYEDENPEGTLTEFLAEVSLVADVDTMDASEDRVVLMTLHSAKGLEFPYVFLSGMEDGLFPSYMSIVAEDDGESIEEERRLCYVGITRAMKHLKLTCAKTRMVQGQTQYNKVSRFVKEISRDLIKMHGVVEKEKPVEHFSNFSSKIKPYTANGNAFENPGQKVDLQTLLAQGKVMRGAGIFDKPKPQNVSPSGFNKVQSQNMNSAGFSKVQSQNMNSAGFSKVQSQNAGSAGFSKGQPQNAGPVGLSKGQPQNANSSDFNKQPLDYMEGDTVRHMKFGVGTVIKIVDAGKDYEVTVDFERVGVKKMFASFAKLKNV